MKNPYLILIKDYFGFIFDNSEFRITEERYEPEIFGDWLLVSESNIIQLRIICDRSEIFIDIKSNKKPTEWMDLNVILQFLTGEEWSYKFPNGKMDDNFVSYQLNNLSKNLEKYWDQIIHLYNEENILDMEQKLIELRKQRSRNFLNH